MKKHNTLLSLFLMITPLVRGMDESNDFTNYKIFLSKQLKLSNQSIMQRDNNKIMIADIKSSYDVKRKSVKNHLLLAQISLSILNNKNEIVINICDFFSPYKKMLSCYGTLYCTTENNVFYQLAVELCGQEYQDNFKLTKKDIMSELPNEKYIIECGFDVSSPDISQKYEYLLFLDIDIYGAKSCTNVIDFITFPFLIKAILAASSTGSLQDCKKSKSTLKIIHWENVILPENYKKFKAHPWTSLRGFTSFDSFFETDFKKMCTEKYEKKSSGF